MSGFVAATCGVEPLVESLTLGAMPVSNTHPVRARRRAGGFTLIELMIAIVVVSVLAAVAFPSFMNSVRKSRRTDAFQALSAVQQAQERYRSNNSSYATDLTSAWPTGLGLSATSSGGHYAVSIVAGSATGYEVTATANSSSSQNADDCAKLGVKVNSGNLQYAGTTSSGTLTYANTSPCWSR